MQINSTRNSKKYGIYKESRVWKPIQLGLNKLCHRIFMAPLTRFRSPGSYPTELGIQYYKQRATMGGLLISEATFISQEAGGYPNAPGIWSKQHVECWKPITKAVHEKGGVFYCQLWALGRVNPGKDSKCPDIVGPSAIPAPVDTRPDVTVHDRLVPKEMTILDIERYIETYKTAAKFAMDAGFDGCEVHGAHGYLLDQFLHQESNIRTDKYGGSLANRARFMLEAIEAVARTIGEERTAVRISPFSIFQFKGLESDPFVTWGYVCREIKHRFPKLAYVSITDPRLEVQANPELKKEFSSNYFRAIFRNIDPETVNKLEEGNDVRFPDPDSDNPTVVISAGGFTPSDAEEKGDLTGGMIGYGRIFIANPDLVHRIKNGLILNAYDRKTFYTAGSVGYNDYPVSDDNTPKFIPSNL
jgi:2,4-dienoyl-CoA reductase-like NADH-dependent reductase (Old Yellow Enzyme family)